MSTSAHPIVMVRVPNIAIAALRTHVERFLGLHGAAFGQSLSEIDDIDQLTLAEMLTAGLRYVREEHPWLGLKGVILEPPEDDPWEVVFAVAKALPAYDVPLTLDGCIEALRKAKGFEVVHERCGHRPGSPRAYSYNLYDQPAALRDIELTLHLLGIVAEEGWLNSTARRNQAFDAALPPNSEPHAFVELDAATACTLAAFIMAGLAHPGKHKAYRAAAESFVEIFGKETRVFALEDLDDDALTDPFAHGSAWSQYDANGCGSWGQTLVVVATDGLRVAYVDALWDVTSE